MSSPESKIKKINKKFRIILRKYLSDDNQNQKIFISYLESLMKNGDYFEAELKNCIDPYGYSYGNGWHYFTSMVEKMKYLPADPIITDFMKFIKIHFHENIYDGLKIDLKDSDQLKKMPGSALPFLTPWSPYIPEEILPEVRELINYENLLSDPGIDNPLKDPKHLAENHYERLFQLRQSVIQNGYNFFKNPMDIVRGYVLKREDEHRILIFAGQHRIAVLAALNYKKTAIKFASKYIVQQEDAEEWPLVKSGLWDKDDALKYFNHLFDFNSISWAVQHELLPVNNKES